MKWDEKGQAADLEAAAQDAHDWLLLFEEHFSIIYKDSPTIKTGMEALQRCISCLRTHIDASAQKKLIPPPIIGELSAAKISMIRDGFYTFFQSAFSSSPVMPPVVCDAHCALCGKEMMEGYSFKVKNSTSEVTDLFRYPSEWLCPVCYSLYNSERLRGNLLALPNKGLRPFISRLSVTEDRPCWRNLIFEIEEGTPTVAIFTDESKRRLWHNAKLSTFGEAWQPLFHGRFQSQATPQSRILHINCERLKKVLILVEECLGLGLSKPSIATNLLSQKILSQKKHPPTILLQYEKRLMEWRGTDEFMLAVFIGQAPLETVNFLAAKNSVIKPEIPKPAIQEKPERKKECPLQLELF